MKKIINFLLIILVFSIFSCKSNSQNTEKSADILIIEGIDIWVRETPTDGKVVMKLNTGNECKVLEIGKEETIKGVTDYWYKIEYVGKIGWVFGSQSNLKQNGLTSKNSIVEFELIEDDKTITVTKLLELMKSDYKFYTKEFEKSEQLIEDKQFYIEDGVTKAIIIVGYNMNFDALLLKKEADNWKIINSKQDLFKPADGFISGYYTGEFELFGEKNICITITNSAQTEFTYIESKILVGLINDKFYDLGMFGTDYTLKKIAYEIEGVEEPEKHYETTHEFVKSDGSFYDLILTDTETNAGTKSTKIYKLIDYKYDIK